MNKIFKLLFAIIGAGIGAVVSNYATDLAYLKDLRQVPTAIISIVIILLFAFIFFLISPKFLKLIEIILEKWEDELKDKSFSEIILSAFGLIVGLVIAFLISIPLYKIPIPYVGMAISIIVYGMLGYLGIKLSNRGRDDITLKLKDISKNIKTQNNKKVKTIKSKAIPKILDTSVIIDGRILDICKTGFLEGSLIIPVFVLEELQYIADSPDALKRNRGRRGLDVVKELQNDENLEVVIYEGDYEEIREVDSKLLKLTLELGGSIVTNDYNLNKVASVQDIFVLNINELANAVKPVYLPGEEMEIQIVKLGKEHNQGLGYLDDGTMIVVESGKSFLGETINVVVTSVLQTAAGKMIFARPIQQ